MSPSHTNKAGVRYRYYVSQALLQSKVQRWLDRPGADGQIEVLVLAALRNHLQASGAEPRASRTARAYFSFIRHLIDRHPAYLRVELVTPSKSEAVEMPPLRCLGLR